MMTTEQFDTILCNQLLARKIDTFKNIQSLRTWSEIDSDELIEKLNEIELESRGLLLDKCNTRKEQLVILKQAQRHMDKLLIKELKRL